MSLRPPGCPPQRSPAVPQFPLGETPTRPPVQALPVPRADPAGSIVARAGQRVLRRRAAAAPGGARGTGWTRGCPPARPGSPRRGPNGTGAAGGGCSSRERVGVTTSPWSAQTHSRPPALARHQWAAKWGVKIGIREKRGEKAREKGKRGETPWLRGTQHREGI